MNEKVTVENKATVTKQTIINIENMSGNISIPNMGVLPDKNLQLSSCNDLQKYKFDFTIGLDGQASEISIDTANAIREWYNNRASDIISEMRNDDLKDTFIVVVEDLRISNIDTILGEIYAKCKSGTELSPYESYLALGVNVLKRDKAFISSAIELLLSNRIARTLLNIEHPHKLQEMIMEILNFSYGDLMYRLPNNRELISLDVFLNLNGKNAKHEQFVAYIDEKHIQKLFGGTAVWDLCGRSVLELGEFKQEMAVYYFMYLAELHLSDFDFSKDSRILDLCNFWIGLH